MQPPVILSLRFTLRPKSQVPLSINPFYPLPFYIVNGLSPNSHERVILGDNSSVHICGFCAREVRGKVSSPLLQSVEAKQLRQDVPAFRAGDAVRVIVQVDAEGSRERVQPFEGVVLRRRGGGSRATFTVRRVSHTVGVERTFFLHAPNIVEIQVVRRGKLRQSRPYYLRERRGRAARIKEDRTRSL